QAFVRNQGEGWGWTLDWLRRAAAEADTGRDEPHDPIAGYLGFAGAIGRRLAEVHAALARPTDDPAFAPEPASADDVAAWADRAAADVDRILAPLARREHEDGGETPALIRSLLSRRDDLTDAVRALGGATGARLKTRVHGDFHLGQVLVAQGDAVIVDFEG